MKIVKSHQTLPYLRYIGSKCVENVVLEVSFDVNTVRFSSGVLSCTNGVLHNRGVFSCSGIKLFSIQSSDTTCMLFNFVNEITLIAVA